MTEALNIPQQFGTIFHRLTEVYNEPYSRLKIEAYWQVLSLEDVTTLALAADRWIAEEERFPRPVEWKRVAHEIEAEARARRPRLSEESTVLSDAQQAQVMEEIRALKERMGWLEDHHPASQLAVPGKKIP